MQTEKITIDGVTCSRHTADQNEQLPTWALLDNLSTALAFRGEWILRNEIDKTYNAAASGKIETKNWK